MRIVADKLDWNRMMGFEQIAADRGLLRAADKLGAKVGTKVGVKLGSKPGLRIGAKDAVAA